MFSIADIHFDVQLPSKVTSSKRRIAGVQVSRQRSFKSPDFLL